MPRPQNMDPESVEGPIPEIIGKTVAAAYQQAGGFHSLDEGYAKDGPVVIEFTDGTVFAVEGFWCNDSTASTEYTLGRREGS